MAEIRYLYWRRLMIVALTLFYSPSVFCPTLLYHFLFFYFVPLFYFLHFKILYGQVFLFPLLGGVRMLNASFCSIELEENANVEFREEFKVHTRN